MNERSNTEQLKANAAADSRSISSSSSSSSEPNKAGTGAQEQLASVRKASQTRIKSHSKFGTPSEQSSSEIERIKQLTMIQDKMVRARKQYHHHNNHHRHNHNHNNNNTSINHIYRHKRSHVPNAPSNTTQFIMNDHESIEPDFDLMHNAIMEHYNRNKKRKNQHVTSSPRQQQSPTTTNTTTNTNTTQLITTTTATNSTPSSRNNSQLQEQPQQQRQQSPQPSQQQQLQPFQESITKSNPTTPNYRPTGSPGDEDGMSPFINHEHLQSEFQEVYAEIHTERLSSMSKNQLVNQYLLLEERVEELENQLRESQTSASHG